MARLPQGPAYSSARELLPDNDPEKQPLFTWRAHANLLYRNWINWVYQMTPYNTDEIPAAIADLRQRVSEAIPRKDDW